MSDSPTDDRNARAGALMALADIAPPRQDDSLKVGGLMRLWPILGARLTGALAAGSGVGQANAASGGALELPESATARAASHVAGQNAVSGASQTATLADTPPSATSDAAPFAANTAIGGGMTFVSPASTLSTTNTTRQPNPTQLAEVTIANADVTYFASGSALVLPSISIVTDVGSPVSADMLNGLIGGLDPLLQLLEQALEDKVFSQTLPMLGSQLKTAFDNSIGALTAFKTLQQDIAAALASLAAPTAQVIQDAINRALTQAGFAGDTATVTIDPGSGSLQLSLKGAVDDPFSVSTAPDLGIPGLDLSMTGTASASLDYSLNVQASVDTSGNWSLTDTGGPALTVGLNAGFSKNFSTTASVGFLQATVTDPNHDTGIHGSFSLDTSGDASFTGGSTIDLHIKTDLTNAILPSLSADLEAAWQFGAATVDGGADISAFGDTPMVAIDNITYDLGSFVDNFLRPILNEIAPIIKPLQDALAVFNYDLMPLFQKIMGASASQLDVNGDGKITLIDFLQKADPSQDLAGLQTFINLLSTLTNFAAALQGVVAPATPFDIGSFTLGQDQDIRSTSFNIAQAIPTQTKAPDDLTGAIAGLSGVSAGSSNVANILTTLLTTPDFNAPAITDGTKAFEFLFGGTGDIFDWNLPTLNLGWGTVDANGTPITTDQLADIVLVPGFPSIDLTLGVAFQLAAALDIGFDTSGLQQFAASNFTESSLIGNGVFLADQVRNGAVVPLLSLGGAVELGIEANAVLASIGGGGDIGGTLGISFTQPGNNYVYQLQSEMSGGNEFAPFTVSGKITAGFDAEAKVFGQTLASWHSSRVTLYSFNVNGAGALPSATFWSSGNGDGEVKGNWSPTFGLTTLDAGGSAYYYGDATVQTKSQVTFAGPLTAEMTSLQLPTAAEVDVTSGVLYIDGSSIDSTIAGVVRVAGTGTLTLQGALNNKGELDLGTPVMSPPSPPPPPETPSVMIAGLVNFYGGGLIRLSDSDSNTVTGTGTNALLWNTDNTISGAGTFAVQILNQGLMNANGTHWMVLADGVTNEGTLEASNNGAAIGGALAGGLQIEANVDNTGGYIGTTGGGAILIDNGVTILGGILTTNPGPDGGVIAMNGAVTFDGTKAEVLINGNVHVGVGSTLTLTGLIFNTAFGTSTPPAGVVASGGTVILRNATFHDGLLNALPPVIGPESAILVSGTSTLDGAGGNEVLGLDGFVRDSAGNTLVLDGTINPDLRGAGIELSGGTIVIGNATADNATLGTDTMGNGGTLLLDDGTNSIVTGADASSVLTNYWTIQGSGLLGNGQLALINAATGTIEATGAGALVVNGGGPMINAGLLGAFNGTLDLHGGVINTAGIIGAASGGTLELDGATIGGGTLRTTDSGTMFVVGSAMLDGTAGGVTVAAGSGLSVGAGTTLTLAGTVTNLGTIAVTGNAGTPATAAVVISGSVDLTGGGSITLADASGGGQPTTQPITGDVTTASLDTDNMISGAGAIGLFALTNEATGTIDASNGTLTLTAANGVINKGLLNSTSGGTLSLTGGFNNAGGTIGASGGVTHLDTALILGGLLQTSDGGSIRASSGISGLASGVTVAANAQVAVDAAATLGLNGPLVNHGTLTVLGQSGTAELLLIGSVTLSGGGSVVMADGSGSGAASTQVITGTSSSDTLDNTGNTISGYGELGLASLTLINEKQGVVDAASGVLDVNTGTKTITNAALLESASGGELDLRSNVSDAAGTIGANGGAVDLIGITVTGGQFVALPGGTIHVQGASTLDASASAVTIAAGAPMAVDPGATLTLKGTFVDNGTLSVTGDGTAANDGEVLISGHVTLGGTGTLAMAYLPGGGQVNPYLMQSVASDGTLDHVSGTISGSGGINLAGLTNEPGAVFDANGTYGGLDIGAATTIQNSGLMEATGSGALSLDSATANSGMIQATGASVAIDAAVANSGTILAQGGGAVSIDRGITVTNTGLVEAAPGNSAIFLSGVIAGAKSTTEILGGGRLVFLGATGTLSGGTLSNAAHGVVQIDSGTPGAELSNIAVANSGTMELLGRDSNPQVTPVAALRIDGTVSLSGGGLVTLTDESGTDDSTSQAITGTTGGATLDNIDNTITGYGQLGAGALTLINEKAGTIEATGGTIVLDTGAVAATNKGLMEAVGGTLTVRTVLDGTGGGTVSALNNGGTASGVILLDGGTLRGGTVTTDLKDAASAVEVTANSGTLDGTAGTLTLAAGAHVLVGPTQSLTATGAIANNGSILISGNPYAGPAELRILGTATLSGGGLVALSDASGNLSAATEIVTGASAAATLNNAAQTIAGYGQLGAGTMTLINGAQGTIDATGGTLTVDTGANTTINQGLIEAVGGLLVQRGVVDGTKGGIVSALNSFSCWMAPRCGAGPSSPT
jgi:hypothetical protein